MNMKFLIIAFVALTIPTGILAQESQGQDSKLKNRVIFVIRHAEDAAHGKGISPAGAARAEAYVKYFKSFTVDGQPLKLKFLFSAGDTSRSHRPRLTLEPTAQAFGLKIDRRFKTSQMSELIHEIDNLSTGGDIVISWRHSRIPTLLRMLGADPDRLLPKGKWPGHVFGWLVLLRYDDKGRLSESRVIKEHFARSGLRKHALMARSASQQVRLFAGASAEDRKVMQKALADAHD
jgi:hypothetical protein